MTINPNSRWSRQCNTEYSENNKEEGGLWNRWEFLVFVRAAPITARKSARPKFRPKVGPILTQRHTKPPSLPLPCRPRRFLARFQELRVQSRARMSHAVPCRRFFPLSCLPHFSFPPPLPFFPPAKLDPPAGGSQLGSLSFSNDYKSQLAVESAVQY
jgi:hypothetical protein